MGEGEDQPFGPVVIRKKRGRPRKFPSQTDAQVEPEEEKKGGPREGQPFLLGQKQSHFTKHEQAFIKEELAVYTDGMTDRSLKRVAEEMIYQQVRLMRFDEAIAELDGKEAPDDIEKRKELAEERAECWTAFDAARKSYSKSGGGATQADSLASIYRHYAKEIQAMRKRGEKVGELKDEEIALALAGPKASEDDPDAKLDPKEYVAPAIEAPEATAP